MLFPPVEGVWGGDSPSFDLFAPGVLFNAPLLGGRPLFLSNFGGAELGPGPGVGPGPDPGLSGIPLLLSPSSLLAPLRSSAESDMVLWVGGAVGVATGSSRAA